jgi:tetratricopeptide (TPR) repeat protein
MIAILFLAGVSFLLYRLLGGAPQLRRRRHRPEQAISTKIDELLRHAARLRAVNRYTAAEKVYLQILKVDHRHSSTYSRLGTLYIAMKNHADAIECFQLASQLSPDGGTFYNLGLAYYESNNPTKAITAFEKSIMFDPSAKAYVGLAKSFNRAGEGDKLLGALERAVELDPKPKVLWLLADAYEAAGRSDELAALHERIRALDPKDQRIRSLKKTPPARRTAKPRLEKTKA